MEQASGTLSCLLFLRTLNAGSYVREDVGCAHPRANPPLLIGVQAAENSDQLIQVVTSTAHPGGVPSGPPSSWSQPAPGRGQASWACCEQIVFSPGGIPPAPPNMGTTTLPAHGEKQDSCEPLQVLRRVCDDLRVSQRGPCEVFRASSHTSSPRAFLRSGAIRNNAGLVLGQDQLDVPGTREGQKWHPHALGFGGQSDRVLHSPPEGPQEDWVGLATAATPWAA